MSNYEISKLKDIVLGEASVQLLCAGERISARSLREQLEKMMADEAVPARTSALKLALEEIAPRLSQNEHAADSLLAGFTPSGAGDKD
ncbi:MULTISPECIES: hypothetical protein [unclassified Pantoea]|uniref:hypothetical protein n=1 Tax=unclassified Pantoea TaxID=2630326 RepID=UPI00301C870B